MPVFGTSGVIGCRGLYLANLYGWQEIADFLKQKGVW